MRRCSGAHPIRTCVARGRVGLKLDSACEFGRPRASDFRIETQWRVSRAHLRVGHCVPGCGGHVEDTRAACENRVPAKETMQRAKLWSPFHQPGDLAHLPCSQCHGQLWPREAWPRSLRFMRSLPRLWPDHVPESCVWDSPGRQGLDVASAFVYIATVKCGPFLSQSPVRLLIKRGLASDLQNKWTVALISARCFSGQWLGDSPLE